MVLGTTGRILGAFLRCFLAARVGAALQAHEPQITRGSGVKKGEHVSSVLGGQLAHAGNLPQNHLCKEKAASVW